VSVNAAPVTATAFGLLRVMVSTETSPVPIEVGPNALATVRRAITLRVALAPAEVPAFAVVTGPVALR
jgi:hypothetical protein